jgi:glycosyltransferase involved in cell wall biosynthesis
MANPIPPGAIAAGQVDGDRLALVTAILPLRHFHEPFLRAALRSLFRQTSAAWELVVVVEPEDRNGFREVLAGELLDHRVRLIDNSGVGLAGAVNSGMRASRTPFVAILLGDDAWETDAVAVLDDAIRAWPDVDFFHSGRRVVDENDMPLGDPFPARETIRIEDFPEGSPVKHLLCWRRDFGLRVGGLDESLRSVGPDDYDFPWVMAEQGAHFRAIPRCLYVYRDHRESYRLTTHQTLEHHAFEIDRILAKHGVPESTRSAIVSKARRGYLRQCLYRDEADREAKRRDGWDPRTGWREDYRRPHRRGWRSWRLHPRWRRLLDSLLGRPDA